MGQGPVSGTLSFTTDKAPTSMNTPTLVTCNPQDITIAWTALTDPAIIGGDDITFYSVEWSPDNSAWTELNSGGALVLTYTHMVTFIFNTTN